MKKIEGYQCGDCDKIWNTEKQALDCENFHVKIDQLEIKGVIFNGPSSNIPSTLIVHGIDKNVSAPFDKRFSARYKLDGVTWIPGKS